MITSEQIRAARALLGINQDELAQSASVGVATIRRIETGRGMAGGNMRTLWKIRSALEDAGVKFLDQSTSSGPGVRLSRPSRQQE
jgi:transcriptional regulator with XRE-family HTH domain